MSFKKAFRVIGILLVIAMLAAAVGCGGSGAPAQTDKKPAETKDQKPAAAPVKIRMGWGIPAEEIKYVMMKRPEILKNHGKAYTIEWFQFNGTAPQVQALAAGGLDAATVASLSLGKGIDEANLEVIVTGGMIMEIKGESFSTTWLAKKDSGIKSVKDLKGKTMGVNVYGASLDYIAREMLQKNGLKPEVDVKIVEVPFGQMEEALRKGQIQAGVFPQPFLYRAKSTGEFVELFKLTDIDPRFVQLINVFTKKFVKDNPAAVKAFIEDWKIAANYVVKNRDEAIKVTSEVSKMPVDLLSKFLITKDDFYRDANGAPDLKALQANLDWLTERKILKKKIDVKNYYDEAYLPK